MEASDLGSGEDPEKKADDDKSQKKDTGDAPSRTWLELLQRIGSAIAPAILTAGGFVGFLAFAGSVIVWTRYQAAEVPPDQVVAAYPQGELVAVASALLLVFGFAAVLAVLILFLVNPEGEASIAVSRALLGLLAFEGAAAFLLLDRPWDEDKVLALELFMLPIFVALWATFLFERESLGEESKKDRKATTWVEDTVPDFVPDYLLRSAFVSRTILFVFVVVLVSMGLLLVSLVLPVSLSFEWVAIRALALVCVAPTLWLMGKLAVRTPPKTRSLDRGEIPFERKGQVLIGLLLAFGAVIPSLLLGSGWLTVSLIAAVGLIAAVWRVAVLAETFMWFGVAVFISVPLFGTITTVARNVADPQVQPVALIREEDGPDESIQGIYVTETEDRVYFATVATEGCTEDLVPNSGRLLWVPREDVVAISIGPPQSVEDAARTALEMSYALTPAVETPAGDHVSLTPAEKRDEKQEASDGPQQRRLEDVGPAVQPNFGRGLRLIPENASPGDPVILRMAAPNMNTEVKGFGATRRGRTLRLGGVPVDILKESVEDPAQAEFVQTVDGRDLSLDKKKVYAREDGGYVQVENPDLEEEEVFVRLTDDLVSEVNDHGPFGDNFLPIELTEEGLPVLATTADGAAPEVVLEDGMAQSLDTPLLRQGWHETYIKFRIPKHAQTGAVTVECEQLAGQPLLRIARPPRANISVRIEPESQRVVFDSSHSTDNSEIVSRRWFIEGVDRGKDTRISESLPARSRSYLVRLKVTDAEGQSGSAELRLLRLSGRLVPLGESGPRKNQVIEKASVDLQQALEAAPAASVEVAMRPGDLADQPNPEETIDQAKEVQRALLGPPRRGNSDRPTPRPKDIVVKTFAFGNSCSAEAESATGRLDVLILGEGVRVVPPDRCPVLQRSTSYLPPP
ncbi:MAG TPA: hypothetical protein VF125_11530 [Solirubrobacterales bacterium]